MKGFWIINFGLFQASWFAAAFYTQYASIIIALLILVHYLLSPNRAADLKVLAMLVLGLAVDGLHIKAGTFFAQTFFPLWLALLWCIFLMSLNHSLRWITEKPLYWAALFGGIGGCASYIGGIKTGALSTALPLEIAALIIACSWAMIFPLLILGYRYLILNRYFTEEL